MKINLILLLLLLVLSAKAQNNLRVEVPINANNETYHVSPVGKNGVLLVAQSGKTGFNVIRYNTDLKMVWNTSGNIEGRLDYMGSDSDNEAVYLLFSRYEGNTFQVAKVWIETGEIENFVVNSVERIRVAAFNAYRNKIYIAGEAQYQPTILYTNLQERFTKTLPKVISELTPTLLNLQPDTLHNIMNVTYSLKKGKTSQLLVRSFDDFGKQIAQYIVQPEEDLLLLNGKVSSISETEQLLIGTYGFRTGQSSSSNTGGNSQGLYFSKIKDGEVSSPIYYSFTDFKNFFNFLSPKEQDKIYQKIENKRNKGIDLKLNYHLLLHNIIEQNGQYVLVAEAYYPQYTYNNTYPYGSSLYNSMYYNPITWSRFGYYGSTSSLFGNRYPYNTNQQVLDGFIYTHAIAVGLDKEGKLLWDNSIEIQDIKTKTLSEKVSASIKANQIAMFYASKNGVASKVINAENVVVPLQLKTTDIGNGEIVKRTENQDIEYWYNDYFISWGYQRIVNDEGKRDVFFLSKLAY